MKLQKKETRGRRGMALVFVTVVASTLAILSLSLLSMYRSNSNERRQTREELGAMYVAEAGLANALVALEMGQSGTLGAEAAPVAFGTAAYWVESNDLGEGLTSLISTGLSGGTGERLELIVQKVSNSFFQYGAFGDEYLLMDSQAFVDSYDSTAGPYTDQAIHGSGSNQYANVSGDVGSNSGISLSQNAKVYGDAHAGPDDTVEILGSAFVTGSTAPLTDPVEMPDLDIPAYMNLGALLIAGGDSMTIGPGEIAFSDVQLATRATLNIIGPATIVVDSLELLANAELWVDASDGDVEIFVIKDFVLNSNTLLAALDYDPTSLTINLNSDNVIDPDEVVDLDDVEFESNAEMYGTIYAPNAAVVIDSNFELFGSLKARSVELRSNSRVHFDEALIDVVDDANGGVEQVLWRTLPFTLSESLGDY